MLPAPADVARGLGTIVRSGDLWTHTSASLYRIAIGFGSALALAVLMGLASFLWTATRVVVRDAQERELRYPRRFLAWRGTPPAYA